jgi:hypothetical protein
MPKPDTADTARGDENPLLPQFIGRPALTIGRVFIGHLDHRRLDLRGHPVLDTGLPSGLLPKTLKALLIIGFLDVVEVLAGYTVDLAGLGDVLKVLG